MLLSWTGCASIGLSIVAWTRDSQYLADKQQKKKSRTDYDKLLLVWDNSTQYCGITISLKTLLSIVYDVSYGVEILVINWKNNNKKVAPSMEIWRISCQVTRLYEGVNTITVSTTYVLTIIVDLFNTIQEVSALIGTAVPHR